MLALCLNLLTVYERFYRLWVALVGLICDDNPLQCGELTEEVAERLCRALHARKVHANCPPQRGVWQNKCIRVLAPLDREYRTQKKPEIYRDYYPRPLLFSVAQGVFWLSTETLMQYIKFKGVGSLYSCTLLSCIATVMSCIDALRRIVTKSPKVWPLLIFSISL